MKTHLNKDQHALYELIWKRFISSQMANAVFDQTSVDISAGEVGLRANGLHHDGSTGSSRYTGQQDENESLLPDRMHEGDVLSLKEICEKQHFTQPPAALHRGEPHQGARRTRASAGRAPMRPSSPPSRTADT